LTCKHQADLGLHLRLKDTLTNVMQEALAYNVTTIQFFLVRQKDHKYVAISAKEKEDFRVLRRSTFSHAFIHSSYWINPATSQVQTYALSRELLKKELRMAQMLEVPSVVLHAGSAKGYVATDEDPIGKMRAIETLAKMLNSLTRRQRDVMILLENTAHGKKTIGSNLDDFVLLRNKLDFPEAIGFCFDTAHAFSYGYRLDPIDDFVAVLDRCMGLENIKLMHFNDTFDECGSMLDRHAFPGMGKIGKKTLQKYLHHPAFKSLPKVIEGPAGNKQIPLSLFQEIAHW